MRPSTGSLRKRTTATALVAAAIVALAPAAAARACEGEGATPPELSVAETQETILCLINQRRRQAGAPKLGSDLRLERAAMRHSRAMDAADFFSHTGPGGSSPAGRIRSAGYMAGAQSWGIAENLHWGEAGLGSPRVAVARWMNSPSHRAALLSRSYREVGIGVAIGSPTGAGDGAAIYTTDFGYRR